MGKIKDIKINNDGTVTFTFKDAACGENGVFEPGANTAGLKIDGMGKASLMLSQHFFSRMLPQVLTHYISSDLDAGTMTCKRLEMFPVEFIWRSRAWGSFCKAYGVEKGCSLRGSAGFGLVEATYKSDELGDPRMCRDAVTILGLMTSKEYDRCENLMQIISVWLEAKLGEHGYELIDFKLEFGRDSDGNICLGDEISGGIWRVIDKDGKAVDPITVARKICNY